MFHLMLIHQSALCCWRLPCLSECLNCHPERRADEAFFPISAPSVCVSVLISFGCQSPSADLIFSLASRAGLPARLIKVLPERFKLRKHSSDSKLAVTPQTHHLLTSHELPRVTSAPSSTWCHKKCVSDDVSVLQTWCQPPTPPTWTSLRWLTRCLSEPPTPAGWSCSRPSSPLITCVSMATR